MRRAVGTLLVIALMTALPATPTQAATITVTTAADDYNVGATCSLREAITAANTDAAFGGCPAGSGTDTIVLSAGSYELTRSGAGDNTNATGDLDIHGDLTIQGTDATTTVITAAGISMDQVFHIGIEVAVMNFSGLTIRDGIQGGVVQGGAATINVLDSIVRNNGSASVAGGAFSLASGVLNVMDSVITDNVAGFGGGIWFDATAQVHLTRVLMSENRADLGGGAIFSEADLSPGELTVTDSTFVDNNSDEDSNGFGDGGAISHSDSPATITGSTFTGNRGKHGDAIILYSDSMSIVNSTISGNGAITTGGLGGGLYVAAGATAMLGNVTFRANQASATGGTGGNIYTLAGATTTLKNTLIGVAFAGSNCGGPGTLTDQGGVIEETMGGAPACIGTVVQDAQMADLADNGGPTETHALQPGSPAIDAASGCEPADQRGVPRTLGGPCDVGAYERALCLGVLVNRVAGAGAVTGTEQADGIVGSDQADVIDAGAGDDAVCARGGDDQVGGGTGADTIVGEAGRDTVMGDAGADVLSEPTGTTRCGAVRTTTRSMPGSARSSNRAARSGTRR